MGVLATATPCIPALRGIWGSLERKNRQQDLSLEHSKVQSVDQRSRVADRPSVRLMDVVAALAEAERDLEVGDYSPAP